MCVRPVSKPLHQHRHQRATSHDSLRHLTSIEIVGVTWKKYIPISVRTTYGLFTILTFPIESMHIRQHLPETRIKCAMDMNEVIIAGSPDRGWTGSLDRGWAKCFEVLGKFCEFESYFSKGLPASSWKFWATVSIQALSVLRGSST